MGAEKHTTTRTGGVSFLGLLALVFIVLKLTHYIAWSWWLVLLPLWGGVALIVAILVLAIIVAVIAAMCS